MRTYMTHQSFLRRRAFGSTERIVWIWTIYEYRPQLGPQPSGFKRSSVINSVSSTAGVDVPQVWLLGFGRLEASPTHDHVFIFIPSLASGSLLPWHERYGTAFGQILMISGQKNNEFTTDY